MKLAVQPRELGGQIVYKIPDSRKKLVLKTVPGFIGHRVNTENSSRKIEVLSANFLELVESWFVWGLIRFFFLATFPTSQVLPVYIRYPGQWVSDALYYLYVTFTITCCNRLFLVSHRAKKC